MAQSERLCPACRWSGTHFLILPGLIFVGTLWLVACTTTPAATAPDCASNSITLLPTATRQADPNLFIPPAPPNGGEMNEYCPTPIPATTPIVQTPEQFVTTEVANLSLDIEHQELAAVAVGDDMLAVAWITDGNVFVALSRGSNHFQVRRVDVGSSVSMAFSGRPQIS